MIYYIADCHFFHSALNEKMDKRGFPSVEEMNEYMINKWNDKVTRSDTVIVLGDFSLGKVPQTKEVLQRLNGKICLIRGNHDRFLDAADFDSSVFEWVADYKEITDSQRKVVLCHYPIPFYNGQYRLKKSGEPKTYMLYGHVHETRDEDLMRDIIGRISSTQYTPIHGEHTAVIPCNMINCFCKRSDYEPLSLSEWIALEKK